jgi:hypothetical protein
LTEYAGARCGWHVGPMVGIFQRQFPAAAALKAWKAVMNSHWWGHASLMVSFTRRTLTVTMAPIFRSLSRIVLAQARARSVPVSPTRRSLCIKLKERHSLAPPSVSELLRRPRKLVGAVGVWRATAAGSRNCTNRHDCRRIARNVGCCITRHVSVTPELCNRYVIYADARSRIGCN